MRNFTPKEKKYLKKRQMVLNQICKHSIYIEDWDNNVGHYGKLSEYDDEVKKSAEIILSKVGINKPKSITWT